MICVSTPIVCITSIYVFRVMNSISIYTGERILKNQIDPIVWDYVKENINRDVSIQGKVRDAYKFARGIEIGLAGISKTGMKFSVISIVPNKCVSTVWRLGKDLLAQKDQIVSDAILERKKAISTYSQQDNVKSYFILDSQQSSENRMDSECAGYDNFLAWQGFIENTFKIENLSYDDLFNRYGIKYGIYWFIKFNGEDVIYEFKSTESHQIDYIYNLDQSQIKQSSFSFSIKSIKDFKNPNKNTFYTYIKNAIGDNNLSQFLS